MPPHVLTRAGFQIHSCQLDVGGRGLGQLAAPVLLVAVAGGAPVVAGAAAGWSDASLTLLAVRWTWAGAPHLSAQGFSWRSGMRAMSAG